MSPEIRKRSWTKHKIETLTQAAPAQNTWYYVIGTATTKEKNVRVIQISFEVGTANETLECKLEIDDETFTGTQAAVAGTDYFLYTGVTPAGGGTAVTTNSTMIGCPNGDAGEGIAIEGKEVRLSIRKTTATGAGTIKCTIRYEQVP